MRKLKYLFICCFGLSFLYPISSCKSNTKDVENIVEETAKQAYRPTSDDIESIKYTEYALSDTAENTIEDWLKFQELQIQIEALKKADLSFFKDDRAILIGFMTDLKNEIPENLNESSIIARLIALETIIYKLEDSATLHDITKDALLEAIGDVLKAHTNLIFQINKKLEKDDQNIQKPY